MENKTMIAYFHRAAGNKFILTICTEPCNGQEFNQSEKIVVANKKEAKTICKDRGVQPWNF